MALQGAVTMRRDIEQRDDLLGLAIVVAVVFWAATCFAGFPGEQFPGPRAPDDPNQLTWTTSQHVWSMVHDLWDVLLPALVGALVGGGLWKKHRSENSSAP